MLPEIVKSEESIKEYLVYLDWILRYYPEKCPFFYM